MIALKFTYVLEDMKKLSITIYKKYIFNKYTHRTRTLIFLEIVVPLYCIGTSNHTRKRTRAS
jgi:hypothetical protein